MNTQLEPTYEKTGDIWLTRQETLRKMIGILGMGLPILLWLFLLVDSGGLNTVLPSISHYYYTRACSILVIVVSLMGIFLLIYKGEDPIDFYISSIAGIFALSLLLFPTDNLCPYNDGFYKVVTVTTLKVSKFRESFHFISAGIFLLALAYMSFFLFTKSDCPPSKRTKEKRLRNKIYRVCAVIMLMAMIIIFLGYLNVIGDDFYNEARLTFWMETIAVEAFGFSWLVKAEVFFGDKIKR